MAKIVLEMLENVSPDVLVLDIIMPHLDGLAVLENMREMNKQPMPNVIMLTAFGQEDVTKKAVDLGASYFILKPFDMDHLASHIRQVSGSTSSVLRKSTVKLPFSNRGSEAEEFGCKYYKYHS